MRIGTLAVLFVACLVLSGCAGAPGPVGKPTLPQPAAGFAFGTPTAVPLDCAVAGCFEPSVAADSHGRVFVTAIGSGLAVSRDNGSSFERVPAPPRPAGVPSNAFQDDVLVQVDPHDRLYYSALLIGGAGLGLQVARSDDGARTWSVNTWVSVLADPASRGASADRQWLSFGAGDTVYLSFAQWVYTAAAVSPFYAPGLSYVPVGLWSARSDDGGRAFGQFSLVANYLERFEKNGNGPPVVDSTGRLFIPYLISQPVACAAACAAVPVGTASVSLAVSEDRGATFRTIPVATAHGQPTAGGWMPQAALGPHDELAVTWWAWSKDHAVAMVSLSTDHGASWTAPAAWCADGSVAASPWISFGGSRLPLACYTVASGKLRLDLVRQDGGNATRLASTVASGLHGGQGRATNTDFAQVATLPDGRSVTVWSDPMDKAALLAVEAA